VKNTVVLSSASFNSR